METTFCELRTKEVINMLDGKRLGKIIDIVLETNYGNILGFIVPAYNKSWHLFKNCDDIFIPWHNVCKIGEDAILVDIRVKHSQNCGSKKCNHFVRTAEYNETTDVKPTVIAQSLPNADDNNLKN